MQATDGSPVQSMEVKSFELSKSIPGKGRVQTRLKSDLQRNLCLVKGCLRGRRILSPMFTKKDRDRKMPFASRDLYFCQRPGSFSSHYEGF